MNITWHAEIRVLLRSEQEEVDRAKHCFMLTLSVDYQQSRLMPSCGMAEQPRSTYYLQKISHVISCVVDHSEEKSMVYLF